MRRKLNRIRKIIHNTFLWMAALTSGIFILGSCFVSPSEMEHKLAFWAMFIASAIITVLFQVANEDRF